MPVPATDRSRKTALGLIFATVCIDLLGFGLVLPLLPIYGKELLADYPRDQAGWILGMLMACYSLMQFIFAPLWGRVSDRVGRRPVLLVSLAGSTFFYGLFGMATLWHSLFWMFAARIGAGIATATIPTAQAYIADITPPDKRTRGMALIGAAFGFGFTLGPLVGALALYLARDTGLSPWPGYAASILSGVALLFAIFKLPESASPEVEAEARRHFDLEAMRDALSIPSIGLLLLTAFFSVFSLANFEGTISLMIRSTVTILQEEPEWESSMRLLMVFAYIGVIQCLVQGLLVRRLAAFISEGWLAATGALLSITGFGLMAVAAEKGGAGLGYLLAASAVEVSGIAFVFPALQSLISRRSDPDKQGSILGAGESISSMARITGMVFGLRLYTQSAALPFWSAAAMMTLVLVLVLVAVRRGRDWSERQHLTEPLAA